MYPLLRHTSDEGRSLTDPRSPYDPVQVRTLCRRVTPVKPSFCGTVGKTWKEYEVPSDPVKVGWKEEKMNL